MSIKLKTRIEVPNLKKENIVFSAKFEKATPSRATLLKEVATALKADEKLVVIDTIDATYGTTEALIYVTLYKDQDSLTKLANPMILLRDLPKAEAKAKIEEIRMAKRDAKNERKARIKKKN